MIKQPKDTAKNFELKIAETSKSAYILRLYVSGAAPRSIQAITNIKQICDKYLNGRYELEVIDTYQNPEMLRQDQVVAMPTLIKKLPDPLRRIIGDLSDTELVLVGLDLIEKKTQDKS